MLKYRHPDEILSRQKAQEERLKETLIKTSIGKTPIGYTQPLNRDEAKTLYNQQFAGAGSDMVLQGLVNLPLNDSRINQLMKLEWRVFRLHGTWIYFCLSDNPIKFWPEGNKIKSIWMPISPDALFVAGDYRYLSQEPILLEEFRGILHFTVNHYQYSQAREFVIARDQGKEKNQFIDRELEQRQYLKKRNERHEN
jgi:hypothetical protein